ncbi:MAG: hypothetical protein IKR69_07590 [Bacteroidales bacterium]|nr:hypothetical protein [Bacteroidales bacterium]
MRHRLTLFFLVCLCVPLFSSCNGEMARRRRATKALEISEKREAQNFDMSQNWQIWSAVLYYRDKGCSSERAKSFYYLSQLQRGRNDSVAAIEALVEAQLDAETRKDTAMLLNIYKALEDVYADNGFVRNASNYKRKFLSLSGEIADISYIMPIGQDTNYERLGIAVERTLNNKIQLEKDLSKSRKTKLIFVVVVSFLLLLTMALVLMNLKYRNKLALAENTKKDIALGRQRLSSLDKLVSAYYCSSETAMKRKLEGEIRRNTKDKDINSYIEGYVNKAHDNIMVRIREELPGWEEREYKLICYTLAGLSAHTIRCLTSESESNIYTMRSRISSKIRASEAPSKEEIISNL